MSKSVAASKYCKQELCTWPIHSKASFGDWIQSNVLDFVDLKSDFADSIISHHSTLFSYIQRQLKWKFISAMRCKDQMRCWNDRVQENAQNEEIEKLT